MPSFLHMNGNTEKPDPLGETQNPSRLAGDRDAVGRCVGIEGDVTPQAPAYTCGEAKAPPESCQALLVL